MSGFQYKLENNIRKSSAIKFFNFYFGPSPSPRDTLQYNILCRSVKNYFSQTLVLDRPSTNYIESMQTLYKLSSTTVAPIVKPGSRVNEILALKWLLQGESCSANFAVKGSGNTKITKSCDFFLVLPV